MKLGIFTDSHYCRDDVRNRTRRPALSIRKIEQAINAFKAAGVELCLCLGDLIDKGRTPEEPTECLAEIMQLLRASAIPYRLLSGNHDSRVFGIAEFSEQTDTPPSPCLLDTDTHRLIFLDASYSSDMTHYRNTAPESYSWKDSNLPPEQLNFLQSALRSSQKPCVVLLHQNLESEADPHHRVNNAQAARQIMEESNKVSLVLQGHYHKGGDRMENGIRYLTVPAMCEGEENHYLILDL